MDPVIQITLERSDYVKKRANLMKTLEIPKLSDAVTTLGPPLAQLVFDECDEALKQDFGLTPPLRGAGDELWVSPSDLLIGKVVLKPPLTNKHVQALTHQGILTIGRDIEVKFWNEMEMEKEKALAEQKKLLLEDFEDQLSAHIKRVELQEQSAYKKEMQRMEHDFEARLLEQLDALCERLTHGFNESSRSKEKQLREEFNKTLQKEIKQTVQNMTKDFLADLERQNNILSRNFKRGLQKAYMQKEFEIRMQQVKYKNSIRQLKHNLECKNLANMMYVLCMERRKCCIEKADLERHYEIEVGLLHDTISLKDKEIKELTDLKNKQIGEIYLRETCLLQIIGQFQKFINFALRASPTQAEFLLSVEKMMVFELTDAILKSHPKHPTPQTDILPWYNYGAKLPEMVKLEIPDHHDCLNEISPPIPEDVELGPDDFLPFFNYRGKVYVREDFRNMVSQGIRITKSSTLWSPDIEILMDTLQQSVSSTHSEREEGDKDEITPVRDKSSKAQATESSKLKLSLRKHQSEASKADVHDKGSLLPSLKEDIRSSAKPILDSLESVDFAKIGKVENAPSILATTSSVELMIRKGSLKFTTGKKSDGLTGKRHSESSESSGYNVKLIHTTRKRSEDSFRIIKKKVSNYTTDSIKLKMDEVESYHSRLLKDDSKQLKTDNMKTDSKHFKARTKQQGKCDSKRFKVSSARNSKESLAIGTRDSIILLKTSKATKPIDVGGSRSHSVEVKQDEDSDSVLFELNLKPSKLLSAKNSLELLKESKTKLGDPSEKYAKKVPLKVKDIGSSCIAVKETCGRKCLKTKADSNGNVEEDEYKQSRKDFIKVSHIEIIDVNGSLETNVAFNTTPVVFDTGSASYSTDLSEVYKSENKSEITKKKIAHPPKDKFLSQKPELKIVGDKDAKEYLQSSNEFTLDRIKSFIGLIKDNPKLIRTFTACTR